MNKDKKEERRRLRNGGKTRTARRATGKMKITRTGIVEKNSDQTLSPDLQVIKYVGFEMLMKKI